VSPQVEDTLYYSQRISLDQMIVCRHYPRRLAGGRAAGTRPPGDSSDERHVAEAPSRDADALQTPGEEENRYYKR